MTNLTIIMKMLKHFNAKIVDRSIIIIVVDIIGKLIRLNVISAEFKQIKV